MPRFMLALSLCFLSGVTLAATPSKGAVYSPKSGVLCDRKGAFCADFEGVSVALTRLYLGAKAEKNLMDQIDTVGKAFDPTTFTMSGGLSCDTKARQCKDKLTGKPDAARTKALFGK